MDKHTHDPVTLFEVGPRDGLQSLTDNVATETKIALVDALSQTGLRKIEVTSFVSPKWVPQLADAQEVMQKISRGDDITYSVLTPNLRGFENAMTANANEVAIFASSSEGFSRKNLNCTIDESLNRFVELMRAAKAENIPVRGYLSTVIACPFDGKTLPEQVRDIAQKMLALGCYEISLGDTIGAGNKATVSALLDVLLDAIPASKLAGHFHDTHSTALEMIEVCANRGMRVFDASVAGLGGCPYAPGATGNVDTRTAAELLESMGLNTGLNRDALSAAENIAREI